MSVLYQEERFPLHTKTHSPQRYTPLLQRCNIFFKRYSKNILKKKKSKSTETLFAKRQQSPSDTNCDSETIREMFYSAIELFGISSARK